MYTTAASYKSIPLFLHRPHAFLHTCYRLLLVAMSLMLVLLQVTRLHTWLALWEIKGKFLHMLSTLSLDTTQVFKKR